MNIYRFTWRHECFIKAESLEEADNYFGMLALGSLEEEVNCLMFIDPTEPHLIDHNFCEKITEEMVDNITEDHYD